LLDAVEHKTSTPPFGMWIKPMAYLEGKPEGDSSMPIKLI